MASLARLDEPTPGARADAAGDGDAVESSAAVYAEVRAALAASGATTRCHISRFDADGAMVFFTLERAGEAADAAISAIAERAAEAPAAGLLRARATLDPYLRCASSVDPHHIMNPGTLA